MLFVFNLRHHRSAVTSSCIDGSQMMLKLSRESSWILMKLNDVDQVHDLLCYGLVPSIPYTFAIEALATTIILQMITSLHESLYTI